MNTELLLKAKAQILNEPKLVSMGSFYVERECGTVACIAGHVVSCAGQSLVELDEGKVMERAVELLDINQTDLFFASDWPWDLRQALRRTNCGTPEYAEVVAKAIDRFIADPDEFTTEEDRFDW